MNLVEFLDGINGGARDVVYHRGLLAHDAAMTGERGAMLASVASAAWHAYKDGKVCLVQSRIAPGICEYIAQVKPKTRATERLCY